MPSHSKTRLPRADQAIIDARKIHGYLLSMSHPIGRFKAQFFGALGFSADRWEELEKALREQHLTEAARALETTKYGKKFALC